MKLLSTVEAADFLGISPDTMPRWRWAGTGPAYLKVGRSVRYRLSDLEDYLKSRAIPTRDQNLSAQAG